MKVYSGSIEPMSSDNALNGSYQLTWCEDPLQAARIPVARHLLSCRPLPPPP